MTTVTLPTVPPPRRLTIAPGRSLAELTAWYGPLPVRRRRIPLAGTSLETPPDAPHPVFRFEFDHGELRAVLTSERVEDLPGDRLQPTADLTMPSASPSTTASEAAVPQPGQQAAPQVTQQPVTRTAASTGRPLDPLLVLAGLVAGVAVLCLLLVGSRRSQARREES